MKNEDIKNARKLLFWGFLLVAVGMAIGVNAANNPSNKPNNLVFFVIGLMGVGSICLFISYKIFIEVSEEENQKLPKINSEKNSKNAVDINKINSKFDLVDGNYRMFYNYYVEGEQYTLGFPKENCTDKRVWVGRGSIRKAIGIDWISQSEAQKRIGNLRS